MFHSPHLPGCIVTTDQALGSHQVIPVGLFFLISWRTSFPSRMQQITALLGEIWLFKGFPPSWKASGQQPGRTPGIHIIHGLISFQQDTLEQPCRENFDHSWAPLLLGGILTTTQTPESHKVIYGVLCCPDPSSQETWPQEFIRPFKEPLLPGSIFTRNLAPRIHKAIQGVLCCPDPSSQQTWPQEVIRPFKEPMLPGSIFTRNMAPRIHKAIQGVLCCPDPTSQQTWPQEVIRPFKKPLLPGSIFTRNLAPRIHKAIQGVLCCPDPSSQETWPQEVIRPFKESSAARIHLHNKPGPKKSQGHSRSPLLPGSIFTTNLAPRSHTAIQGVLCCPDPSSQQTWPQEVIRPFKEPLLPGSIFTRNLAPRIHKAIQGVLCCPDPSSQQTWPQEVIRPFKEPLLPGSIFTRNLAPRIHKAIQGVLCCPDPSSRETWPQEVLRPFKMEGWNLNMINSIAPLTWWVCGRY
ncbi:uncharacterized protein [Ambystoma mexicanum]|uniref:uncharacterized protein isoform X13 n=1 Tax=Ambystoma mexicanum TaxID=8296 RepID=UPI0037E91FE4